jgi:exo-beta-1,3-glucanase (GH17 family)
MDWVEEERILTFFFEAFDETWKGSPEILEPEKHWGLFKIDRSPKLVMKTEILQ